MKAAQIDLFRQNEQQEGRRLRDEAKARLATSNGDWLETARNRMVEVIKTKGSCSSDDCWKLCPPPADAHPSVMGCLFDDERFVRIGDKLSERASARSRRISTYELRNMEDML
jgi:hypothetical protein